MLVIAGLVLLALGVFSGAWLVLSSLGLVAGDAGVALWILFPLLGMGGYLMAAAASERSTLPTVGRLSGALLVLLALASAAGLVLHASGLLAARSTGALWYVLLVGLALGASAWAAHSTRLATGETRASSN